MKPEAIAKVLAEPVTDEATLHEVDHMLEMAPDTMIPDPAGKVDEDGRPVMVPLKDALDEADADAKAAGEIESCVSGEIGMAA